MGLAEPRKRLKISHDPNNLAWSQAENSYGQRLLLSQGWKAGQRLGARNAQHLGIRTPTKVLSTYKDDLLGLGATLKSKDFKHGGTGLDAFQGLLGRLNGKSDVDLHREQEKTANRDLAMWAQGRFGGVVFVPGGLLVQGEGYKDGEPEEEVRENDDEATKRSEDEFVKVEIKRSRSKMKEGKEKKKKRNEDKMKRKDVSVAVEEMPEEIAGNSVITQKPPQNPEDEQLGSTNALIVEQAEKKKKKKRRKARREEETTSSTEELVQPSTNSTGPAPSSPNPAPSRPTLANGRHVLRSRNIEAKRMAFTDAKMLDEIFMRNG